MPIPNNRRNSYFLLLATLVFSLLAGELILRQFFPPVKGSYLFPPSTERGLHPKDGLFPGISGPVRYPINEWGFRGHSIPPGTMRKALAIGGSTTECLYLDQSETWVQLLEDGWSKNKPAWVGNFSKSGLHTGHHVQQLQWALQQPGLNEVSHVFILTGFNDLIHFLGNDSAYLSATDSSLFQWAFSVRNDLTKPIYARSGIWKAVAAVRQKRKQKDYEQDYTGEVYLRWRRYRMADTTKITTLPPLEEALQRYAVYLSRIQQIGEAHGISIIFMTQPVLWASPAKPEHESLFWLGKKGDFTDSTSGHYYTTAVLAQGMEKFNTTLREVVARKKGWLIDLDALLPKDLTVFYDDCHFNESGARRLAQQVLRYVDSAALWK